MKAVKVLKDLASDKDKNKDKLKKLEVDKKFKELESLKAKIAEVDAKKAKEIEEKLAKIRESGFDISAVDKSSPTDKYVQEIVAKQEKEERAELPILDFYSQDEKQEQKIEKILETKVSAYREDLVSDDVKKKSEDSLKKEFFDKVNVFNEKSLPTEYE